MASVRSVYTLWYKVTKAPHPSDKDFCLHCGEDKAQDKNSSSIISPHHAHDLILKITVQALFPPSTRARFDSVSPNAKFYNFADNSPKEDEWFSNVSGSTSNEVRMKGFQKSDGNHKQKHGGNTLFFIF